MTAVSAHAWVMAVSAMIVMVLTGCSSLPGQGPSAGNIGRQTAVDGSPIDRNFALIDVTPATLAVVNTPDLAEFRAAFGAGTGLPAPLLVGAGDRLSVQIWESVPAGRFSSVSNQSTGIMVEVDNRGDIYVPYAGRVHAMGATVDTIRQRILERLKKLTVDPEVVVTAQESGARSISVTGDARTPGRFDVPSSGLKLLDAVAMAGGSAKESFNTDVILQRGERRVRGRLDQIITNPRNNIWLAPHDAVHMVYSPRSFTAFGAVSEQKQQPFMTESLSLMEAIGQSGGMNDQLADKGGVFLVRFEPPDLVVRAGGTLPAHVFAAGVPTVYRFDFREPEALFLARSFVMQDKDIVYVSTAPAADFGKFSDLILRPFLVASGFARLAQ